MDSPSHFQILARYNAIANQRLYEACGKLTDEEYRKPRTGSFGSIHSLLNHILLGDRIWMGRFEGDSGTTPPLNTVLYDEFPALHTARVEEDARMERFFQAAGAAALDRQLSYVNSKGQQRMDPLPLAAIHLFNHQTHHRGQIHVMLAQTSVAPPNLDLHWAIRP
jgi:uncharacterized damage-inducible protein DinB